MAKRDKATVLACERMAVGLRLAETHYEKISELVIIPGSKTDANPEGKRAYSNAGAAQKAVIRALRRDITFDAGDLRLKAVGQINTAMGAIWPDVLRGKLGAIDRMAMLQRQLATLVEDLSVPETQKHELTGANGTALVVELAVPPKGSNAPYPFPTGDDET